MYWRLKNLPELRGVSQSDARRIVNFVARERRSDRKTWLSATLMLPPMFIAFLVTFYYFREQFIIRSCVLAVGSFTGAFLSRVVSINTVLRHDIREVMNSPRQLESALHGEEHLADRVETTITVAFVAFAFATFLIIVWSNLHEHTR